MEIQLNKAGLTQYDCCFTKPTSRCYSHHHPDVITSVHENKSKHFNTNICHVLFLVPIYTLHMFSPEWLQQYICVWASESTKPLLLQNHWNRQTASTTWYADHNANWISMQQHNKRTVERTRTQCTTWRRRRAKEVHWSKMEQLCRRICMFLIWREQYKVCPI